MKTKEIRGKSDEELRSQLLETTEKLASLRFDVSMKRLSNVREIRVLRRDIAIIRTILHERRRENEDTSSTLTAKKETPSVTQ